MDDFTRKFDAAQDKDEQIHFILTSVYEALKVRPHQPDRGLYPVRGPHLYHQPQRRTDPDLQGGPGRAAAGAGEELSGNLSVITKAALAGRLLL